MSSLDTSSAAQQAAQVHSAHEGDPWKKHDHVRMGIRKRKPMPDWKAAPTRLSKFTLHVFACLAMGLPVSRTALSGGYPRWLVVACRNCVRDWLGVDSLQLQELAEGVQDFDEAKRLVRTLFKTRPADHIGEWSEGGAA